MEYKKIDGKLYSIHETDINVIVAEIDKQILECDRKKEELLLKKANIETFK